MEDEIDMLIELISDILELPCIDDDAANCISERLAEIDENT